MLSFLSISILILSVLSSGLVQRQAQFSKIRILPATLNVPNLTASTFLPENTLPSASLSALPTSPFNVSSNVTDVLDTIEAGPMCNRELGRGLTVQSCVQARSELKTWLDGRPRYYITIGQPGYGVWDINDRITFLSSDRVCAFDFWVAPGGEDDQVTVNDLTHASSELMLYCVIRAGGPAGGSYGKIGLVQNVVMEVQYERPFPHLECLNGPPAAPPVASCFALRNFMPKSGDEQTFGNIGWNVDVALPYTLLSVDGRCALTISTIGPDDSMAWYDIYKAVTEIEASCVRRGLHGLIYGLGEDKKLFVMLLDPLPPVPGLATNTSMNNTSSF